jgi:adenylyl-sulfate kinase
MVDGSNDDIARSGAPRVSPGRRQDVHWQALEVTAQARADLLGNQPRVLWFTGLSGAGKTTIAGLVEKQLHALGRPVYVLDGDNVRQGLNKDLGFTDADRVENIRRVAEVAKMMADAGLIVLVSLISPFRAERRMARELMKPGEFIEIFVDTPLEVAEARDPKGLYKKARRGELKNFTAIDSPYERPEQPEVRVETTLCDPATAAFQVLTVLQQSWKDASIDAAKQTAEPEQSLADAPATQDEAFAGAPIVAAAAAAAAAAKAAAKATATLPAAPAAASRPPIVAHGGRTIYSFIVDADPKTAYKGYYLSKSLIEHGCDHAADVNVQFTREVGAGTRALFDKLGCTLHDLQRFGDARTCNKIAQLANLHPIDFDHAVLLDSDMIAIADPRPYLSYDALTAKVVDLAQPPLEVLEEIARLAGMQGLPPIGTVDAAYLPTYTGHCDSAFFCVPKAYAVKVDQAWRRWALWLLDHMEPLTRTGTQHRVDQVSMWLAITMDRIPYRAAPSNINYHLHPDGDHRYFDANSGIVLLHYSDASLNAVGKVEPRGRLNELEQRAVAKANAQIDAGWASDGPTAQHGMSDTASSR